ncbi:MAG: DinB family protein [Pseudonocardiaceae bacterium]
MEQAEYQSRIRTEAGLLRTAAVDAGADTPVPTCPDWPVQRLIQHVSRVFDMVVAVLRAADPDAPPPRVERPTGEFDTLLAGFDDRLSTLLDLLAATDPGTPVWNFSPTAPRTAAFWSRRMAHELTVHRLDAQAAAGTDSGVDPDFAADGVDEVLTRIIQRRTDMWAVAEFSGTVLYHAADAGRAWAVRLVPGQLPQTAPESVTEPDASVVGLADAVYRAAWGRPSRAVISGDTTLLNATQGGEPARPPL